MLSPTAQQTVRTHGPSKSKTVETNTARFSITHSTQDAATLRIFHRLFGLAPHCRVSVCLSLSSCLQTKLPAAATPWEAIQLNTPRGRHHQRQAI